MFTALDALAEPTHELTAGELDVAARSLAARLLAVVAAGERVLVPSMQGLGFQVAFLACLYAGVVAVPVPAVPVLRGEDAARSGQLRRLAAVSRDANAGAVIVPGSRIGEVAAAWAGIEPLRGLRLIPAEPDRTAGMVPVPERLEGEALAYLQYTSGSTLVPRGVMVTHGAVLANQEAVRRRYGVSPTSTVVSWLPAYHDLGLGLGALAPMYNGCRAVLLEPAAFMRQPESWLRALSRYPDTLSAAPDFAYAWCARRVREPARSSLDLRGWRLAISGAEPVRASTLRAFQAAFEPCGLDPRVLAPSYGLAEATLFVSGQDAAAEPAVRRYDREALGLGRVLPAGQAAGPAAGRSVELVGCGTPGEGIRVAVVDPQTRRRCGPGRVGEIWVHSPANGTGYWGRPHESRETFEAALAYPDEEPGEGWLRTGDLGFLDGGELFIAGRRKDVVIIRGVNHYPQDFESLAQQAHPLLRDGLAAAFGVADQDRVTVVVEMTGQSDPAEAAAAAGRAVVAELPVMTDVVVVRRGQVPRTTSGKVRRQECARRLRSGQLAILARWPGDRCGTGPSGVPHADT